MIPRLDTFNRQELRKWLVNYQDSVNDAVALFPDRPPDFERAYRGLRAYAICRETMLWMMERGSQTMAGQYEELCRHHYLTLPGYARWPLASKCV